MIAYLNHTKVSKVGNVFHLQVRTQECAQMLLEQAKSKGIEVDIKVIGIVNLTSKENIVEYFKSKQPIFNEFITELGLKIV